MRSEQKYNSREEGICYTEIDKEADVVKYILPQWYMSMGAMPQV